MIYAILSVYLLVAAVIMLATASEGTFDYAKTREERNFLVVAHALGWLPYSMWWLCLRGAPHVVLTLVGIVRGARQYRARTRAAREPIPRASASDRRDAS